MIKVGTIDWSKCKPFMFTQNLNFFQKMITTAIFFCIWQVHWICTHIHKNMHVYVCTNRLAIKYCLYLHVHTSHYSNNSSWKIFHARILRLAFFFFICYIIVFGVVLTIHYATVNSRVFLDKLLGSGSPSVVPRLLRTVVEMDIWSPIPN